VCVCDGYNDEKQTKPPSSLTRIKHATTKRYFLFALGSLDSEDSQTVVARASFWLRDVFALAAAPPPRPYRSGVTRARAKGSRSH